MSVIKEFDSYLEFIKRTDKSINGYLTGGKFPKLVNCMGCWQCADCENCVGCVDCYCCTNCKFCDNLDDCENSEYLAK